MENDGKSYKRSLYVIVATAIIAAVFCLGQFVFEDREKKQTEYEEINGIQSEYEHVYDIQKGEDEGAEILKRFRSIDWGKIRPRTYLEDSDWYANIFYLARLPEDDITMYGYNDDDYHNRGVAIAIADDIYYFDWYYFSPRQVEPQMYWNDEDKQLQITFCLFTGSDVHAEELHVLQLSEENEPEDHIFAYGEYTSLLSERIGFSYEKDNHMITFYDNQDNRELVQADLSWLEEKEVEEIWSGDIARFQLGDEIYLIFKTGYMVEEWASVLYDGIPEMAARVQLEISDNQISFGLEEIDLVEGE